MHGGGRVWGAWQEPHELCLSVSSASLARTHEWSFMRLMTLIDVDGGRRLAIQPGRPWGSAAAGSGNGAMLAGGASPSALQPIPEVPDKTQIGLDSRLIRFA